MFELLKKELEKDNTKKLSNILFYIDQGYMPTWAAEYQNDQDRGLKQYSTPRRWEQYQRGEISRPQAVEFAARRAQKQLEKQAAAKLEKLEQAATAPDLDWFSVSVDWVKSRAWGYNPHTELNTIGGRYYGSAIGCGYDKESAAIAEAFNSCASVLKILYQLKNKGLQEGLKDSSKTACTGHDNRNICGYGAGYDVLPAFEGGVGASCFWAILEKCGYKVAAHNSKYSSFYTIKKEK